MGLEDELFRLWWMMMDDDELSLSISLSQSRTEGEPTAQPPETVCQPASSVASCVISLHQAAGKFEISETIKKR